MEKRKKVKVLFSPVGFNDPMSKNGEEVFDGSLLHIFRFERPDFVYLYMTEDIKALSDMDDRYVTALSLLAEKMSIEGWDRSSVRILDSQVRGDSVIDMDAFYQDYLLCVEKIKEQHGPDINLIYNISSGTPAMKAALYVLKSINGNRFGGQLFQVKNPTPDNKPKEAKTYETEVFFKQNKDNQGVPDNRISPVKAQNIRGVRAKAIIEKFLGEYNYRGALRVYEDLVAKNSRRVEIKTLLEFADERKRLNISDKSEYKDFFDNLPNAENYRSYRSMTCQAAEYFLRIGIYLFEEEYRDMVLAMTPLNTYLLKQIFYKWTKIYLDDVIEKDRFKKDAGYTFRNYKRVNWSDYADKLISPAQIVNLLKDMGMIKNPKLKTDFDRVIDLESNVRRPAAHEMCSISSQEIRDIIDSREIEDMERRLLDEAGIQISGKWDSYDKMNESIMEALNR